MAILKCVVVICYAHADSIGCSMVGEIKSYDTVISLYL